MDFLLSMLKFALVVVLNGLIPFVVGIVLQCLCRNKQVPSLAIWVIALVVILILKATRGLFISGYSGNTCKLPSLVETTGYLFLNVVFFGFFMNLGIKYLCKIKQKIN